MWDKKIQIGKEEGMLQDKSNEIKIKEMKEEMGRIEESKMERTPSYYAEFPRDDYEENNKQIVEGGWNRIVQCVWKLVVAFRKLNLKKKMEMEWDEGRLVKKKRNEGKVKKVIRRIRRW